MRGGFTYMMGNKYPKFYITKNIKGNPHNSVLTLIDKKGNYVYRTNLLNYSARGTFIDLEGLEQHYIEIPPEEAAFLV